MNYESRIKNLVFVILLLFLLFEANAVFALEINYPNLPGVQEPQEFLNTAPAEDLLGLWVKYLVALATWASGIIALMAIIWAGIVLTTSVGNPEKLTQGRKRLSSAILGLVIVLCAYFILEIISPYFIDFTLPKLEDLREISKAPPIYTQEKKSTIDVYVPFGRIIENVFQTYYSDTSEAGGEKNEPVVPETLTRPQRIKNTLNATLQLLPDIRDKTEEIRYLAGQCECYDYEQDGYTVEEQDVKPDPRCDDCENCNSTECTSDPCEDDREEIVEIEQELLPYLFGIEEGGEEGGVDGIIQHDAYGKEFEITTSLMQEIAKTEKEIQLLKEDFNRLGRMEELIRNCDWQILNNRNQYFQRKDYFEEKEWYADNAGFWDDVNIFFNRPIDSKNPQERWYPEPGTPLELVPDESALYCAVGGTNAHNPIYFETEPEWDDALAEEFGRIGEMSEKEAGEFLDEFSPDLTCTIDIPIGEILDKAHRVSRLLVNKLDLILKREKELIEAAGDLQVAISQCTSKLCWPICFCYEDVCIELPCFGPACPRWELRRLIRKIRTRHLEITDAITGVEPYDTPEKIGVYQIFDTLVLDLLESMENTIRIRMKKCVMETPQGSEMAFWPCKQVIGGTDASGKIIRQCFIGTKGRWRDTLYGGCLNNCFLNKVSLTREGNYTNFYERSDFHQCVDECMDSICIYNYNHVFNYFCCYYE